MNIPMPSSSEGGFSVLEASLTETLDRFSLRDMADLLAAGFSVEDVIGVVATTPPFSEVLTDRVHRRLRLIEN